MKTIKNFTLLLILSVLLASCGQKKIETDNSHSSDTKGKKHEHVTFNTSDEALNELKKGNKRFVEN